LKKIGLLPCSGACNLGMTTTKSVINVLNKKENTDFVCALGLPLGIEGIIKNGKSSHSYIAVNGCKVKCASKALQSADIEVNEEIVLTEDYSIKKNKNYNDETKLEDIENQLENLVDSL